MSSTFGCSPSPLNLSSVAFAAIAHRGLCSFADKASAASLSGPARILVVINNESSIFTPSVNASNLSTLLVSLDDGLKLLKRSSVRVWAPPLTKFDPNIAIFAIISITLIVVGSLWSAFPSLPSSPTLTLFFCVGRIISLNWRAQIFPIPIPPQKPTAKRRRRCPSST